MENNTSIISAARYYLSSLPTLFRITNFWQIPLIYMKKPFLIKLDNKLQFYIEELMDVWVIKEIVLDRQYERLRPVKSGDIVVDIGAAFGDFSIWASKKAKKVYAFDPNLHRLELMRKNLKLNNCKNVKVVNQAVDSLDRIFADHKIDHCHFLKIDCEGAEYEILRHASKNTLSRIDYIAIEIHLFNKQMQDQFIRLKAEFEKNVFILEETINPVHNYLKFLFAKKRE